MSARRQAGGWPLTLASAIALTASWRADAHATSTSYLAVKADAGQEVALTWDIAAADVHWQLGLDSGDTSSREGDGQVTWGEIEAHRDDVFELAQRHLTVARGAQPCRAEPRDLLLANHAGLPHLSLSFRATCAEAGALTLKADLFFDADPTQRTLIDVAAPTGRFTSILSPGSPQWLQPAAPSILATLVSFIGQGVWHVWIGYDHVAFIFLLLLPGVLRASGPGWRGTTGLRETAGDLFRIVTAFTLAHSLTLALAATGTVTLPTRPIEIAIAASIVVAGLLNLFPRAAKTRLPLAFGFGLVHGFGFANALAELGASGAGLVPALAGFNIGVELAQLSLVLLVLPVLFRARNSAFYAGRFMPAASLCAAMAGAAWLVARTA